ncbi:MAG: FHA domain-containing protein, partial [Salinivirgaceae bacterium]|nr:FHA domain-containing protein [Salinivirgaceae bacterium]
MKNTIKIGLSNSNDIVVDRSFKNVSDCHATISLTDKGYLFKDHSANGSYINDSFVHN